MAQRVVSNKILAQRGLQRKKWQPVEHFPLTEQLHQKLPKIVDRSIRVDVVSEKLAKDIFQRLSPLLRRPLEKGNIAPLDILDLWPGCGMLSSKFNDLLKPRRHILAEPSMKTFSPWLKPLAASKPCYTLEKMDIYSQNDWKSVFKKLLPEQCPSGPWKAGKLRNNDALLVLANPPEPSSTLDHYTPARWWGALMEDCLNQTGVHQYGSVRILAVMPMSEARIVLPQTIADRSRPALLTESVALQAVELATCYDDQSWIGLKGMDLYHRIAERVAERSAARGTIIPAGREQPALRMAPEQPNPTNRSLPHTPRVCTDQHDRLMAKINGENKKEAGKARTALGADNRIAYYQDQAVKQQLALDDKMNELARLANSSDASAGSSYPLRRLGYRIQTASKQLAEVTESVHYRVFRSRDRLVDEERSIRLTDPSFDDAPLLWDRRPFEPLSIGADEIYPRKPVSVIFFEADKEPIATQKLKEVKKKNRAEVALLFDTLTKVFRIQNQMTVAELVQNLFPELTKEQVLREIPGLLWYADKRWLDGRRGLQREVSEEVVGEGEGEGEKEEDPDPQFMKCLDYDFTGWRVRCLPVDLLWDIILVYQRHALDLSVVQLSRRLGATLTTYGMGEGHEVKRMH